MLSLDPHRTFLLAEDYKSFIYLFYLFIYKFFDTVASHPELNQNLMIVNVKNKEN